MHESLSHKSCSHFLQVKVREWEDSDSLTGLNPPTSNEIGNQETERNQLYQYIILFMTSSHQDNSNDTIK